MKFTLLLFLLTTAQVFGTVYSQSTKLNVNLQNATLVEILSEIEDQSEFKFLYNNDLLENKNHGNVDFEDTTVEQILDILLEGADSKYSVMENNLIVISPAEVIQQGKITGKVTDLGGFPLPGVSIIVKGTTTGTTTNIDGEFNFEAPEGSELLIFSFIGMETQEISLDGKTEFNVVMAEATTGLDEVMIVGYGTQSNRKVSSALSQVSDEDLEITKRPVVNTQQAMIGAMPGLIVNQTRGEPGASADIRVRETSALASRNAMVLIDGFPGSLSDVSPNDIGSITVLKDAAATAIYGARGANGVVLITTKSTKKNKDLSLTYNFNYSRQNPAATPEISNSYDFMEFFNHANLVETLRNNPGTDPSTVSLPFTQEDLSRAQSGFYPETQWVDEMYSNNAGQMSHNVTINGGAEKIGYLVNLGSLNQNGIVAGSDNYKRLNLRLKIDTDITNWLSIGTNASITNRNTDNVPVGEGYAIRGRPFFPVQLEDGTFVNKGAAGLDNPVANLQSGSYDRTKRDALNVQLYGQLKPVKGLVIEERVSLTRTNTFREIWDNPYDIAVLDMELNQVGDIVPAVAADRKLDMRSERQHTINTLTTAKYDYNLDNMHFFNAMLGLQTEDGESVELRAERLNFILPNLQDLKLGQEIDGLGNSSNRGDNRTTISYFGRLGYDYKAKYLAEVSFRADASSNFGPNNKWGYFPSVSLGWNVMEESFMDQIDLLEMLKFRASWGQSGDDGSINVIEDAPFDPTGIVLGGVINPSIMLGNSMNPDLKWETSEKINLGLDLSLAKGLFGMSVEYFVDNRKDIITVKQTSLEGGLTFTNAGGNVFNGILDNVYDAKSWGWEFDLSHKNKIGDFTYNATFNLTYYNSEITNTEGVSPLDNGTESYKDIGLPIRGNWYGYEVDGYFDDQAELDGWVADDGNPIDQSTVSDGDEFGRYLGGFKYKDQITVDTDGDEIPDAKDGVINADDRVVLKTNAIDNYRVGFGLGAGYKGFSLSARFYGVLSGWQWWRGGNVLKPFTGDVASYVYQTDTWREDNKESLFPQATASNVLPYETAVDHFIHKNSYIKLKNINLGYTFNKNIIEKLKIVGGLDVYVSVENLGTIWTNNPSHEYGWDPELGTGNFRYPLPLTTAFGVNVNF